MSSRPQRKSAAAARALVQQLHADDADEDPLIEQAPSSEAYSELFPVGKASLSKKAKRAKRELGPSARTIDAIPLSRSTLSVELQERIAEHLYDDMLSLYRLMLVNRSWYKVIASNDVKFEQKAKEWGAKVRKKHSNWMQTYFQQCLTVCYDCRGKTAAKFPMLPSAPKSIHVCTTCQYSKPIYRCISEPLALSSYQVTQEDLEQLPFKWTRIDGGGRYSKKYQKDFLHATVVALHQEKKAAERQRVAMRLAFIAAQREKMKAMVMKDAGHLASLEEILEQIDEEQENHTTSFLQTKYLSIIDSPSITSLKALISYYDKLSNIEDTVTSALEAKDREDQTDIALQLLDQKPSGSRKGSPTWAELLADGSKAMSGFLSAVLRAYKADQKGSKG